MKLLRVENLTVTFSGNPDCKVLSDVSFDIAAGETVGIMGESGSGKTQIARAIMGLLDKGSRTTGRILFRHMNLLQLSGAQLNQVRAREIAMIFQDPANSLNPYRKIGAQLCDVIHYHKQFCRQKSRLYALEMLDRVRLSQARQKMNCYPQEFSGGQLQRVMIAMALACEPSLLIADEPTTALDSTIQKQVLDLLEELQRDMAMSMILISHDPGVMARLCNVLQVVHKGKLLESGPLSEVMSRPRHLYTKKLIQASQLLPFSDISEKNPVDSHPHVKGQPDFSAESVNTENQKSVQPLPLLAAENLYAGYDSESRGTLDLQPACFMLENISFKLMQGQCFAVVGESGSGKTTLARLLCAMKKPSQGQLLLREHGRLTDRYYTGHQGSKCLWSRIQMIFQSPFASLNPQRTILKTLSEPLMNYFPLMSFKERQVQIKKWLDYVRLPHRVLSQYPHMLSGGQCQRVAIVRALLVKPDIIICDEPVSALDVSVQAQIIELLLNLKKNFDVSLVFISHDLKAVKMISDCIMVLRQGKLIEKGLTERVFRNPQEPYTRLLLDSSI